MVLQEPERRALRVAYERDGFGYHRHFLSEAEAREVVATAEQHRASMIRVDLDSWLAQNKFFTINGDELEDILPIVPRLRSELCELASELEGRQLAPLQNKSVGQSLNLTPGGGKHSWHYDRNLVTAVIHLNSVQGGDFEMFPRYRVRLRDNHRGVRKLAQRVFDLGLRPRAIRRVLGHKVAIPPRAGALSIMDSTCLHQVAPVRGTTLRAALVIAFDEPGKVFSRGDTENYYGYRDRPANLYG
ncbi:MAG TPA: hypothetical protein VLT33_38245 [Labilithrix sp.]|nr:hypothetical protein [Labilithrix sp.]